MAVRRLATQIAAVCAFAGLLPPAAGAQGSADLEVRARARFSWFDGNQSGWLSGRELDACGCRAHNRDGNSEVTWAEFYRGELQAAVAQMQRDAGVPAPDDDRPAQAERPAAAAATRAAQPAPPVARTAYEVGQSVEVNVDGTWYGAMIVGVRDGRYALSRHDRRLGVTTDNEWTGPERLRPYVAKRSAPTPSATALPAAVPTGDYSCTTYQTNQAIGKLRIYPGGMSSGVTREALRPQYRFTYDPRTGAMAWPAGLTIVGFSVEEADYGPQLDRTSVISLHYRREAGGHLNSMYCTRQ